MNELNESTSIKQQNLITIDKYYNDLHLYNESLHALENNKIGYDEWISTITPYEFYIHIPSGNKPLMMNYDTIDGTKWKMVVSKVKPIIKNDEVKLYRRGDKVSNIRNYINNDVFDEAMKKTSIVFLYANKDHLKNLSKSYGKIYPLGKYINGSRRLGICFDTKIKNALLPSEVLLELGPHKIGKLETSINWEVLRNRDKIQKWTKTPYFLNGMYFPTKPVSPLQF